MTRPRNRLLFWTDCFWPTFGGSETWSRSFLNTLRDRGWDIAVIAFDNEQAEVSRQTVDGIAVMRPPMRVGLSAHRPLLVRESLNAIAVMIDDFAPDCIQINGQRVETLLTHSLAMRKRQLPTLLTFHAESPEEQIGAGSLVERVVVEADLINIFDDSMARWVLARWPDAFGRITFVPHALIRAARPWHPAAATGVMAFCGRLSVEKGLDIAVSAFARILPHHPGAKLMIAGDGDQRLALETQAHALGVASAITFTGWVEQDRVDDILDESAFAIMPSRLEPFGLYALEAAWRGRAVIAGATGGLPNQIDDGKTGLLVPPGDIAALATAMDALLSDPKRAAELGAASRMKAEQRPSWQMHVAAFEALFEQLITNHAGAD